MRNTILIVDDAETNRSILTDGFIGRYNIAEAETGAQALDILSKDSSVAAVLLDIMMPEVDGIGVLKKMNETGLINRLPVFIITSAEDTEILMKTYDLGAVDVIRKPFIMSFLKCRVENVIELYRHRNELEELVQEQVNKLSSLNKSMIETLAALIEFRDCESGEHVRRICVLTDILMKRTSEAYPEYRMSSAEIEKIVSAAVLHDIGKISIPDSILRKPGRLTQEEYEIMKTHTVKGCEILGKIPEFIDRDMYDYCYDIIRHHHERWDGTGYPDKLKGDQITVWSQAVAIADVYDALTSQRVYKAAFPHDTAVKMINTGECGAFNPKVLAAFNYELPKIERAARMLREQES